MSGSGIDWTVAGLWLAVIASGLYHGVNPGMGWPLAVSAGMMEKSPRALVAALAALAAGHLVAMLLMILPFSLLLTLVYWQRQIRIGASLLVIGFGAFRLVDRRHPRALARIRPTQLGLWSFAAAHRPWRGVDAGADLSRALRGRVASTEATQAAGALIGANLGMAVLVSIVHSGAMIAAGGLLRMAGLSLSRAEIRVAELVQSRRGLGREPDAGGGDFAGVLPGGARTEVR